MNFFASDAYLNLVGEVYFPGRSRAIRTVSVEGRRLRLLEVDGRFVTNLTFLDYHDPFPPSAAGEGADRHWPEVRAFAPWVVRDIVPAERCDMVCDEQRDVAPFVDWTRFSSFEDYWGTVRGRPNVREYERRLRRLSDAYGPVTFTPFDQGDDVLDLCRAWKSRQLRLSGLDDFYDDPTNVRFFKALRDRGLLFAATLRASGHLLSAWLGVIHDGSLSGWIFTHAPDPELKKYSPGQGLLQHLLRYSYEQGHRQLDFSVGAGEYKTLYATDVRILGPVGRQPFPKAVRRKARQLLKDALRTHPALFERMKAARIRRKIASGEIPEMVCVLPDLERERANRLAQAAADCAGAARSETAQAPAASDLPSPAEIEGRLIERLMARKNKDFVTSDRIRDELAARGICIKDQKDKETGELITSWAPVGGPDAGRVIRLPVSANA